MSDKCNDKIKIAVVVGYHPYDVPKFQKLFESIPDIEVYIQHMEQFVYSSKDVREEYNVVLFYNFHMETPVNEAPGYEGRIKEVLESLGDTKQGIFVLHHAILAFPNWQIWSDICGIQNRKFGYYLEQNVHFNISDIEHPITRGITDFELLDETYTMDSAGEDSQVLITTNHPKSMKTIAWTRQYKNSRVFCYESGHDNQAYNNENFIRVVSRGIQWLSEENRH